MRTVHLLLKAIVVWVFVAGMFSEGHAQNVQFSINPKSLCKSNAPVIFTNTSSGLPAGAYTWSIDFGDGTTPTTVASTVATISHFYPSTGVAYFVTMSVSNASTTYTAYVQIFGSTECASACATAAFVAQDILCYNKPVDFFSTSFFPNGPSGYTYSWNFDDPASGSSNTSNLPNPTHYFMGVGPFTVSLTVSVSNAALTCSSTATQTLQYQMITSYSITSISSILNISPSPVSLNVPSTYQYTGPTSISPALVLQMNFGAGLGWQTVSGPSYSASNTYTAPSFYNFQLTFGNSRCVALLDTLLVLQGDTTPKELPCSDCIGSFAPIPGKKYLISAWVKEDGAPQSKTSYTYPNIMIKYPSLGTGSPAFFPAGMIIDGWQRIEGEFVIPAAATDLRIQLSCSTGNCFFDDIRVLPFDGSMNSYVYDPVNMRLVAELDERNYATLYEYDEEGKLIRVKKETIAGKSTITENRNNTKK